MKKFISLALASLISVLILCSCAPKANENVSSVIPDTESTTSIVSTNSQTVSKVESKSESKAESKTESKSESKVESKAESKVESKKEESIPAVSQTASKSESVSVIKRVDDCLEMGIYHFQPYWTTNYGDSEEDRLREFEDVIKQGYFNSFIASPHTIDMQGMWDIVEKYDLNVWMSLYDYYQSDKQTLDEWLDYAHEGYQHVLKDKNRQKYFKGFFFDEPIWRGQSNADFLAMTEALYKKYGRRIYVVDSLAIFANWRSEADNAPMDKVGAKFANSNAFKYVTDLGFDHYTYDVRPGAGNGGKISNYTAKNPEVTDAQSLYRQVTKNMLKCAGDKNVWYWPCAFTYSIYGGLNGISRADEAYCLAHIDFFYQLLKEQKYQGGIHLYTYKNSTSNPNELGLASKLIVVDENGTQLLFPSKPKWQYVSAKIKNICQEYDNKKANHVQY